MNILKKRYSLATALVICLSTFGLAACDDNDSPLTNAAQELSEGMEDAVEALDNDKTVGEKVGETVEDAGEKIQDVAQ
ncbi:MAG: hypothetical protein JJ879_09845 [Sneathiella sp.]|nr:hypothetical protein [Sneathiella sp.]